MMSQRSNKIIVSELYTNRWNASIRTFSTISIRNYISIQHRYNYTSNRFCHKNKSFCYTTIPIHRRRQQQEQVQGYRPQRVVRYFNSLFGVPYQQLQQRQEQRLPPVDRVHRSFTVRTGENNSEVPSTQEGNDHVNANESPNNNHNTSVLQQSPLPVTLFTEDEIMIRDTVRQWCQEKLLPLVRKMDNQSYIDDTILQDLFALGYMSIEIPTSYPNGSGLNFTSTILIIEEMARIDPSIAILVDIHNTLIITAIQKYGTPQQQQYYLSRLGTYNYVSAFCLSESTSGSDAFALQTTATLSDDGSYYTINGTKSWISNAQYANVFIVFANIDPKNLGYKGITAFIIDKEEHDGQSIIISPPERKLGLRASSTCQITFDHVQVDASKCVLGQVGMGYKYCIELLNEGRIGIAAQQLGIAKACLYEIGIPYMMERKQFDQVIGTFQGMQHQYAAAATDIYACETMIYNTCRLKEHGHNFIKEASMCKYYTAKIAQQITNQTIDWLGGIGYTDSTLAEKMYRDVKVGSIYEGTTNIQLQTIAKLLMKEYLDKKS